MASPYLLKEKGRAGGSSQPAEQHAASLLLSRGSSSPLPAQESGVVTQRQSPLFLGWLSGEAVSARRRPRYSPLIR